MMADTLGFLVQGRFESASIPPASPDPYLPPPLPFRSRFGLIPSLVSLPFLAATASLNWIRHGSPLDFG